MDCRVAPRFASCFLSRRAALALLLPTVLAGVLGAAASRSAAADWPQFLGPDRKGISSETGLVKTWPEGGLPVVWRVPGGVGMSAVAVRQGLAVTQVQSERGQELLALDAATGKERWRTALAPAYKNQMGDGPRATPTIAPDGRVYAFTGDGVLAAVDAQQGRIVWSLNLIAELGGKVSDYGMACSPLLAGELIVVTVGAPGATVCAVSKEGRVVWKSGNDPAGYSSPAELLVGGRRQIVAFTGNSALGLDPQTGSPLWRHPYVTDFDCNIATPISVGERVLLSAGENHGSVLLELSDQGGRLTPRELWSSQGRASVLRNEWQTSILLDGHLYGLDNVGSAGPVTHLTCVEAATGKRKWQQLRFGKSNLIAADGKLFCSTMNGELVVVRATPDQYEELGRMEALGATRQAPSLSNGRLYLRDNQEIVCLDARAER